MMGVFPITGMVYEVMVYIYYPKMINWTTISYEIKESIFGGSLIWRSWD